MLFNNRNFIQKFFPNVSIKESSIIISSFNKWEIIQLSYLSLFCLGIFMAIIKQAPTPAGIIITTPMLYFLASYLYRLAKKSGTITIQFPKNVLIASPFQKHTKHNTSDIKFSTTSTGVNGHRVKGNMHQLIVSVDDKKVLISVINSNDKKTEEEAFERLNILTEFLKESINKKAIPEWSQEEKPEYFEKLKYYKERYSLSSKLKKLGLLGKTINLILSFIIYIVTGFTLVFFLPFILYIGITT